jgi:tRNA(fMet)-specific endonuclease VapC
MYILDTDHLSILERGGASAQQLRQRLKQTNAALICTTIVNYEEQMRGWLAQAAKVNEIDAQIRIYRKLEQNLAIFCKMQILSFDNGFATKFHQLRKAYPRLGTMDLKIAAIAITQNTVLLTRNLSDFGQITEIQAEDWSI